MLVAVADTELFETCGAKNYFLCRSKELAIDVTHALSQLVKYLSKVLRFNGLEETNENTSKP